MSSSDSLHSLRLSRIDGQRLVVRVVEVVRHGDELGLADRDRLLAVATPHCTAPSFAGRASSVLKNAFGKPTLPAAAGQLGGVGRQRDQVGGARRRRSAFTAFRIATCCASTPMMLAATVRAFLFGVRADVGHVGLRGAVLELDGEVDDLARDR